MHTTFVLGLPGRTTSIPLSFVPNRWYTLRSATKHSDRTESWAQVLPNTGIYTAPAQSRPGAKRSRKSCRIKHVAVSCFTLPSVPVVEIVRDLDLSTELAVANVSKHCPSKLCDKLAGGFKIIRRFKMPESIRDGMDKLVQYVYEQQGRVLRPSVEGCISYNDTMSGRCWVNIHEGWGPYTMVSCCYSCCGQAPNFAANLWTCHFIYVMLPCAVCNATATCRPVKALTLPAAIFRCLKHPSSQAATQCLCRP